jgi:hypothetical protein
MWNKIYLIAFAVFLLLMSVLTYISSDWLGSITDPRSVVSNYEYYSRLSGNFLWISALILLVLANVLFWKTRQAWAFWTTLLYFAFFIVLHTFWLDRSFIEYKRTNGLLLSNITLSPFLGVGLCLGAAFIVFFNQFVAMRMHDKMYAKEEAVEHLPENEKPNDEKIIESEN